MDKSRYSVSDCAVSLTFRVRTSNINQRRTSLDFKPPKFLKVKENFTHSQSCYERTPANTVVIQTNPQECFNLRDCLCMREFEVRFGNKPV